MTTFSRQIRCERSTELILAYKCQILLCSVVTIIFLKAVHNNFSHLGLSLPIQSVSLLQRAADTARPRCQSRQRRSTGQRGKELITLQSGRKAWVMSTMAAWSLRKRQRNTAHLFFSSLREDSRCLGQRQTEWDIQTWISISQTTLSFNRSPLVPDLNSKSSSSPFVRSGSLETHRAACWAPTKNS